MYHPIHIVILVPHTTIATSSTTVKSNVAVPGFLTSWRATIISTTVGIVNKSPPKGPRMSLNVCQNHRKTTPIRAARRAMVIRSIVVNHSSTSNFHATMSTIIRIRILTSKVP